MADIPKMLRHYCLLPIDVLRVLDEGTVSVVLEYNFSGLDVRKEIRQEGLRFPNMDKVREWFGATESHFVQLIGGFHGSGDFFGYDKETNQIRSLRNDMVGHSLPLNDDEQEDDE